MNFYLFSLIFRKEVWKKKFSCKPIKIRENFIYFFKRVFFFVKLVLATFQMYVATAGYCLLRKRNFITNICNSIKVKGVVGKVKKIKVFEKNFFSREESKRILSGRRLGTFFSLWLGSFLYFKLRGWFRPVTRGGLRVA